jgi:hypothetical protein
MLFIQYAWHESFREAKYVTKRARKRHRTREDVTKARWREEEEEEDDEVKTDTSPSDCYAQGSSVSVFLIR